MFVDLDWFDMTESLLFLYLYHAIDSCCDFCS